RTAARRDGAGAAQLALEPAEQQVRRPVIGYEMVVGTGPTEMGREPVRPLGRFELHHGIGRGLSGGPARAFPIDHDDASGLQPSRRHRAPELAHVEGPRFPARDHDEAGNADHFAAVSLASACFFTRAWMLSNMSRPAGHFNAAHSALRKPTGDTSRR